MNGNGRRRSLRYGRARPSPTGATPARAVRGRAPSARLVIGQRRSVDRRLARARDAIGAGSSRIGASGPSCRSFPTCGQAEAFCRAAARVRRRRPRRRDPPARACAPRCEHAGTCLLRRSSPQRDRAKRPRRQRGRATASSTSLPMSVSRTDASGCAAVLGAPRPAVHGCRLNAIRLRHIAQTTPVPAACARASRDTHQIDGLRATPVSIAASATAKQRSSTDRTLR